MFTKPTQAIILFKSYKVPIKITVISKLITSPYELRIEYKELTKMGTIPFFILESLGIYQNSEGESLTDITMTTTNSIIVLKYLENAYAFNLHINNVVNVKSIRKKKNILHKLIYTKY